MEFFEDRPFFKNLVNRKDLIGCEIGVASGKNALDMLTHLNIKRLYLVDPYINYGNMKHHGIWETTNEAQSYKEFAKNTLSKYKDKIVWIEDLSENVANLFEDNTINFVYIDGSHRYEHVKKDIELYYPKVKNGFIAGHDYKSSELGVIKAVNEYFGKDNFKQKNWDWWSEVK